MMRRAAPRPQRTATRPLSTAAAVSEPPSAATGVAAPRPSPGSSSAGSDMGAGSVAFGSGASSAGSGVGVVRAAFGSGASSAASGVGAVRAAFGSGASSAASGVGAVRASAGMGAGSGLGAAGVGAASAGEAVLETVCDGFSGRVAGVFPDGFYVSGPAGALFAVLRPSAWPGPLHLVMEREPPVLPAVHDRVTAGGDALVAGRLVVRLDRSPRWAPRLPQRFGVASSAWRSIASVVAPDSASRRRARPPGADDQHSGAADQSPGARNEVSTGTASGRGRRADWSDGTHEWHRIEWRKIGARIDPSVALVWEAATDDVRRGDLVALFGRLQGRGAGLTPSGDDMLAGVLLVCAMNPGRRRALRALANSARTTSLSRAFLMWAAVGQSIQPAHELLEAAAAGDLAGMHRSARSLASVGATSGRALVAGIALAAPELPPAIMPRPHVAQHAVGPASPVGSPVGPVEPSSPVGLPSAPALPVADSAATVVPRPAVA